MGDANDERRRMLADLMRTNSYPRAVLDGDALLARPSYCEVSAWGYRIGIGANRPALQRFQPTGKLDRNNTAGTRNRARTASIERSSNSARRTNDLLGKEPAN
jgi:hypothetical protein